jgi:hypothetical protein
MSFATERRPALGALLMLGLLACGDDAQGDDMARASVARTCFVGDPALGPELEVVYRTATGEQLVAQPMGHLPLIEPPQGGKVMFIGVRARNVDGCGATLTTALVEPGSGSVVSLERRPVFLDPQPDGWLHPRLPAEMSNYSNLPACPRANLARSIASQPYDLKVVFTDVAGRSAERVLPIVPTCGEPERYAACECECAKDYVLGGVCSQPDAAAPLP